MNEREVQEAIKRLRRSLPPKQPTDDRDGQILIVLLGIYDAVDRSPADGTP